MSINLDKNRDKLVAAWKSVLDDKTDIDWALFGYEGQSNDLKVVATGDGGLEELAEDLNSGKIQYAFVSVQDPKTTLTKFVLINWQGEGVQSLRKGVCANHIRDVSNLFTGAHLTVNARLEDEVEKDKIIQKVSAVGSAYSFKEQRQVNEGPKIPVGTAYSRVNAAKEINPTERSKFWERTEEEEKRRVNSEKDLKKQEVFKADQERKLREEKEHNERERRTIVEIKTVTYPTVKSPVKPLSPSHEISPRGPNQADLMRQQRNQEAKELIGSRVGTAKAIFTQNTSSGQMLNSKNSAPIKPVRNSIAQRINTFNNQQNSEQNSPVYEGEKIIEEKFEPVKTIIEPEPIPVPVIVPIQSTNGSSEKIPDEVKEVEEKEVVAVVPVQVEDDDDDGDQYSTIKRSPHLKTNSQPATPAIEEKETKIKESTRLVEQTQIITQSSDFSQDDMIYPDMLADMGMKARALYDYQAADESEITFDPGDIITHIDQIDEGWWQGLGPDSTYGLFPANYVELIQD